MDRNDDTTRGGDLLCYVISIYMRKNLEHMLKLVVAIMIGIEVSYPPNPYKEYLIVGLISLIILKNNLDVKIQEVMEKWLWK
tara:strand:+ start:290 stop:535 length:246 start_codon:yes stop_codon:yes gene_type:complete